MIDTSPPVVWTLPIEAAQVFVADEFVYRSGGYVVTCADEPGTVLGLAKEAAPQADGEVEVLIATAMTAFILCVHDTTVETSIIDATDMGVATYSLVHLAGSGLWYIDKNGTGAEITIQQFVDAVGTTYGRVLATIVPGTREVA